MTVYEFPSPATTRQPPEFSLYADGRVIYMQPLEDGGFDLRHAQLDQTGMDEIAKAAIEALHDVQGSYDDIELTDMSTTVFDIRIPQLNRSVSVYALGEADDQAPSAADRARMRPLRDRLLSFAADVRAGHAVDLGAYEPEQYLVQLYDAPTELPDRIDWPWPGLDTDDFAETGHRERTGVMTPSEMEDVLRVAIGSYLITTAPSGDRYVIHLTPLLPDQIEQVA